MRTPKKYVVFSSLAFFLLMLFFPLLCAEEDPRVKVLLQEGLRLYSERQYIRALDYFKQVERIDPENSTATTYIKSAEDRISEWETQGKKSPGEKEKGVTWDSLLDSDKKGAYGAANAKDIIAARRSLVERMRNRSMNTENIVQIKDSKRGLDITLFHDQLFLPGLQTLRDEALPILEDVAQTIRQKGDTDVTVHSLAHQNSSDPFLLYPEFPVPAPDPTLPNKQEAGSSVLFQDIEATRSLILFTYIAQRSMGRLSKDQ